jgi:hypothetical protein
MVTLAEHDVCDYARRGGRFELGNSHLLVKINLPVLGRPSVTAEPDSATISALCRKVHPVAVPRLRSTQDRRHRVSSIPAVLAALSASTALIAVYSSAGPLFSGDLRPYRP